MKKINLLKYLVLFCTALVFACGGSSDSDDPTDDDPNNPQQQLPGKANALLPVNGEPCSEFEDVDGEPNKALIFFQWSSASFTNSYRVQVLEGGAQVAAESLNGQSTEFVLDRGKTYTWTVTSVNSDGEAISDTFSFTSPGIPVSNYAPYAAEISIVFDIPNMEMDISWSGSDEDGDPLTYDVEVLQEGITVESFIGLTTDSLDPIPFIPGQRYQIRVVTRDNADNYSISVLDEEAPD